jgi:type II secretion system protein G
MRRSHRNATGRAGFSLMEILVALVLIGLMVAVIVPSVINQLGKGEVNRVVEELESVRNAAKAFRVDVQRWPGEMEQLITPLDENSQDIDGTVIPAGLRGRWAGPYLEVGALTNGGLPTALGGSIDDLEADYWEGSAGNRFVIISVSDITENDAKRISQLLDGHDVVTAASGTAGRIRWSDTPDRLLYFAIPVN